MMKVRQDCFTVKSYHCQVDGSLKIVSLMRYLQEAASAHAQELGFGSDRLSEIDSYWVLSNVRIEIAKLPKWNDEVTIRTWPSGHSRVVATREFVGSDRQGDELFRAGSEWMILNRKTGRLRNLRKLDLPLSGSEEKVLSGELDRLEPRDDYSLAESIRVRYSSIDLNGHVNNTEYVRWGIDAIRGVFEFTKPVGCVQITYLCEAFENDTIDLSVSSNEDGCFCLMGKRPSDGSTVYLMEIAS